MTIGVVAALAAEGRALRGGESGRLLEKTLLQVSGVGAAAATRAAESLVRRGARALISWGVAGALDPALAPGAICLPAVVLERAGNEGDGTRLPTHAAWRATLAAALRTRGLLTARAAAAGVVAARAVTAGPLLTEGTLLSGVSEALSSVATKRAAHAATGAVAVDMESAAVARVAEREGLPFVVLRVIVDTAADEIPGSIVNASRAGRVRLLELAGSLLLAPAEILPLLRLAGRYRIGLAQLRAVARTCPLVPA